MTGLQAEGVIDQAYFVCGAEGSWPSPEAHVAAALTEQWNDAANVFCLAPGTVVAYKSPGDLDMGKMGSSSVKTGEDPWKMGNSSMKTGKKTHGNMGFQWISSMSIWEREVLIHESA
jgi:hypothetical protein